MTNRTLEIFAAVAESGRMSEAAHRLYITQSSVSQAIAEVEKEYSVLLFDRLNRGLFLTPTGEVMLDYAKRILNLNREMEQFLQCEAMHQQIRIGATVTVGTCVIPPLINRLQETLGNVSPEVYVDNTHIIEEMLLRSELDIGLVEGQITQRELVEESVIDDLMVLICPPGHPFFGRAEVGLTELEGMRLVLREPGSGTRAQLVNLLNQNGISCPISWTCTNSEAIKNAVHAGHGISLISKRLVNDEIENGSLWSFGIEGQRLNRKFCLVHHRNKYLSDTIKTFAELARQLGRQEKAIRNN